MFHIKSQSGKQQFVFWAAGRLLIWNICAGSAEFCGQQWKKVEFVEASRSVFPSRISAHRLCPDECDAVEKQQQQIQTVRWCFWLRRGCRRVWELHPCSISGLWAVVCSVCVSSVSFRLWFLSFLSLLPPCRVLLRTSCCLVITVWLSPSSLLFLCLAEVSCSLHSSAASSTSSCLSLSWFCIAVVFLFSGVILWVHLLFVDLLSFWLSDTPSPLPAVRSPMVQCCACL